MFCIFVQVQKDHNKLQIIFLVKENKNILQKVKRWPKIWTFCC